MVTKCGMSLSVWVLLQYKDRLSGGKNTLFPSMEIPIIDIRRSHDCLFFIMRIAILVKQYLCSGSAGASVVAHSVALPLIEIAFSTLDCSIVPTCGAWCSATAAKRGPLKQSWAFGLVWLLHMPGFPGSSLGSGGWGLRCQELMRSSFYFILFIYLFLYFILFIFSYFFFFFPWFTRFQSVHKHICIYPFGHIHIYIYFVLPFCAAPSLSPPWLTLSVRWGDTCAFGCLVSWWGGGRGTQG